jgi:hypothetical protein
MEKLGADFDLSRMLVVDCMHEVELGVWKALFAHLIRILYSVTPGGRLVGLLNERYSMSFTMLLCSGAHALMIDMIDIDFVVYLSSIRPYADFQTTFLK